MKMLVIGDEQRTRRYLPALPVVEQCELVVVPRGTSDDQILEKHADADFIMADAISLVSAALIAGMPNLKLIHSEGVAFNAIDCKAATDAGVYVCNNAGVNAGAVAEQAVLLMLGCLRGVVSGHAAVMGGQQIQTKERLMAIPGTPPNMIYPPKGDAFAARNRYAMKIDFEKEPPFFKLSDTHMAATWLLHPKASAVNKIEMPEILRARIERMKKMGEANNG